MKILKCFSTLILLGCVYSQDVKAGMSSTCDPTQCDWVTLDHYRAMNCTPVINDGECCPTNYKCQSEAERGLLPDKCYYKGISYNINEDIVIPNDCTASCRCVESVDLAEIVCVSIECPPLSQEFSQNCREIFEPNACCAVREECENEEISPAVSRTAVPVPAETNLRENEVTCSAEGEVYLPGDQMFYDDFPCQQCVCGENYTNPNGPGCHKIDCGIDAIYRRQLRDGCVPIYLSCCFFDFMCPDDPRIVATQEIINASRPFCTIGDIKIGLGSSLETSDCETQCACEVPPLLTCRYDESKCFFGANP